MRFKSDRLKPVQPELVASRDDSRPVLTKVHLNVDKSRVEVTDSFMLATFPVDLDEGDTSGPIPVEALKAARKSPFKHASGGTSIRCNSHAEVCHAFGKDASAPYVTLPRDTSEYTFPNIDQLVPEESSLAEFTIGLNPTKLLALAKSMGSADGVKIRFVQGRTDKGEPNGEPAALRPFLVRPLGAGDDDPSGLIMPIRVKD